MKIILSTRNPSKAEQIRGVFKDSPFTVLTLAEAGIEGEAIEDGETLGENSLKKALFAWEKSGRSCWTMADDTGLFIDALQGLPGIKAARWAGESATTEEIMRYTLQKIESASDRTATFRTTVTLVSPDGGHRFFTGEAKGKLLEAPRVPPQPKMPYSGIFLPDESNHVWAEMTVEEENLISHRGKAFRKTRDFLEREMR
jgi:XTP/dITP diphosphohydrolase